MKGFLNPNEPKWLKSLGALASSARVWAWGASLALLTFAAHSSIAIAAVAAVLLPLAVVVLVPMLPIWATFNTVSMIILPSMPYWGFDPNTSIWVARIMTMVLSLVLVGLGYVAWSHMGKLGRNLLTNFRQARKGGLKPTALIPTAEELVLFLVFATSLTTLGIATFTGSGTISAHDAAKMPEGVILFSYLLPFLVALLAVFNRFVVIAAIAALKEGRTRLTAFSAVRTTPAPAKSVEPQRREAPAADKHTDESGDSDDEPNFVVQITSKPKNLPQAIALVAQVMGVNAEEAEKLFESMPLLLKPMNRDEANALRTKLQKTGCQVKLQQEH